MIKYFSILTFTLVLLTLQHGLVAQESTAVQTFKDTRVINTQSVETLKKRHVDFRVGHRFGDLAGSNGGWSTFYGLENSTDVSIGFDFGLTDNTMLGLHRMKGSNVLRQLVNLSIKQKLMTQDAEGSKPFGLAVFGLASISTMPSSPNPGVLSHFDVFAHRMSYHIQVILSKKIGDRFSLQIHPAWTYRNLVPDFDTNDIVSIGYAAKAQLNRNIAVIVEGNLPFSELRTKENGYYSGFSLGIEWDTGGGHIFQVNLTNATGMTETDYIPYTQEDWSQGQFRLGFTIGRQFKV